MGKRTTVLPDQEKMLEKLKKVSKDQLFQERFYPLLIKHAGKVKNDSDAYAMFHKAINEASRHKASLFFVRLYQDMPKFVDAIVNDKKVAERTKAILRENLTLCTKRDR